MTAPRPGIRSIARNAAFLGGSGIAGSLIRFAYVILVARGLGPEGYGILSSLQGFYLIFVFAVTAGLPFYLSRERAAGQDALAARQSLAVVLTIFSVGAGIFLVAGLAFEPDPTVERLYPIFVCAILARGMAIWARHLFVAREASEYHLTQTLVFRAGELAAVAAALALGWGLWVMALVHAASWLAEAAASLVILRRRFGPIGWPGFAGFRTVLPEILGVSLAFAAANWLRVAPLVAYRFGVEDAVAAGRFALAWNAAMLAAGLIITVMNAAAPAVARAKERDDGKDLAYLDFWLRIGPAIGALGAIAALGLADWVVLLIGGADYAGAGRILIPAAACLGPVAVNHALDQTLFLHGRTRSVFRLNASYAVAAAALIYFTAGHGAPAEYVLVLMSVLILEKSLLVTRVVDRDIARLTLRSLAASALAASVAFGLGLTSPWLGAAAGLVALPALLFGLRVLTVAQLRTGLAALAAARRA